MIKAVEHFSFTVGDMEKSLFFFCHLLGLSASPIMEVDHPDVRKIVGMPDAQLRIALVDLPGNQKIELIEYRRPIGKILDLETNNPGVAHIAFEVADLQGMYRELTTKGIRFISAPVWAPGNDGKGTWGVCYLRGPDQITLELIEKKA